MSNIQPSLTPLEWIDYLDDYDGDVRVPPYPPDSAEEFYNTPRKLAALCLYRQPFGFTRSMLLFLRDEQAKAARGRAGITSAQFGEIADRIEALLPPEKPAP